MISRHFTDDPDDAAPTPAYRRVMTMKLIQVLVLAAGIFTAAALLLPAAAA